MSDYLYPTQADEGRDWAKDMLRDWRLSHLQYLCFPFMTFKVHTLRNTPFCMYMYCRQKNTDIASLKGKLSTMHVPRGRDEHAVHILTETFKLVSCPPVTKAGVNHKQSLNHILNAAKIDI